MHVYKALLLLALLLLCLTHLEYASAVWAQQTARRTLLTEKVSIQIDAVRFITTNNIKGKDVRGATGKLFLQLLEQRRKTTRHISLLLKN